MIKSNGFILKKSPSFKEFLIEINEDKIYIFEGHYKKDIFKGNLIEEMDTDEITIIPGRIFTTLETPENTFHIYDGDYTSIWECKNEIRKEEKEFIKKKVARTI